MLDGAIGESAHGGSGIRERLPDPKAAIEVANGKRRISPIGSVEHEDQHQQQDAGCGPQEALPPTAIPGDGEREQGSDKKREGQVVVERKDERRHNADEKGSQRAARGEQKIKERRFRSSLGAQRVSLGMAKQAGDENLNQKKEMPMRIGSDTSTCASM